MLRPALLLSLVLFGLEVAAGPVAARDFKITFTNKTEKELDFLQVTNDLNDENVVGNKKVEILGNNLVPAGKSVTRTFTLEGDACVTNLEFEFADEELGYDMRVDDRVDLCASSKYSIRLGDLRPLMD
jgi:hypothetical protein